MNRTAWLDKRIFEKMTVEADLWSPKETGGVFMVYWSSKDEAVITDLIGPGSKAVHFRYSFTPDVD